MTPSRRFITLLLAALAVIVIVVSTVVLLSAIQEANTQFTLTVSAESQVEVTTQTQCAWVWARQDLPDVTALARQALAAAEIDHVEVRAEAYGENCLTSSGEISYFAAMTTDFYLTVPAARAADDQALSALLIAAFEALAALPLDQLPARPGYFDARLTSDAGTERHFRAMFDQVRAALDDGLTGADWLAALAD